ncbi:hypothetical protein M5K25_013093 [Dendrobium thyrsiflorum]|uniref:Uncharacterized protein n=1 Tax=Dendrobium thyrsiflorum TaxID=117978 RepID=A0ABD0UZD0_DENTH
MNPHVGKNSIQHCTAYVLEIDVDAFRKTPVEEIGLVDMLHSPFFDIDFENDHTVEEYMDRILFSLATAIDQRQPPVQWQLSHCPLVTSFSSNSSLNKTLSARFFLVASLILYQVFSR